MSAPNPEPPLPRPRHRFRLALPRRRARGPVPRGSRAGRSADGRGGRANRARARRRRDPHQLEARARDRGRNAPRCLVIGRYGVGVDNIPVELATELGIVVANVPDFCVNEVADHAMGLLLACARRLVTFTSETRSGVWSLEHAPGLPRLAEQTLGIVGFGRIAQALVPRARGFGLRVLVYTPRLAAAGVVHRRARRRGRGRRVPRRAARRSRLRLTPRAGDDAECRLDRRARAGADEADRLPDQHLTRRADRRGRSRPRARRTGDRRRRARRALARAPAGRPPAARCPEPDPHAARGVLLRRLDPRGADARRD